MNKYFCKEKITIGVSVYGNLEATKNCIEAIKNSLDGNYDIILVDDCSPGNDEIKNFFLDLKKEFKNIKVFHFSENLGYVESVNCILSNDIYINPYFIEELINISDIEDRIGYVRGVSNFVDNNMATHNISFKNKTHFNPNEVAKEIFLKEKNNFIEDKYLVGDCFLVNKELIEKIGYFDCSNFKDYFGDVDFSLRAKALNFKCILSKGAFCFHHKHTNFEYLPIKEKKEKMQRRQYFIAEDWARFKLKYKFPNNLVFPGINRLNFNEIKNKVDKKKVVEVRDYSQYLS